MINIDNSLLSNDQQNYIIKFTINDIINKESSNNDNENNFIMNSLKTYTSSDMTKEQIEFINYILPIYLQNNMFSKLNEIMAIYNLNLNYEFYYKLPSFRRSGGIWSD
jgi:hypothetical protein